MYIYSYPCPYIYVTYVCVVYIFVASYLNSNIYYYS